MMMMMMMMMMIRGKDPQHNTQGNYGTPHKREKLYKAFQYFSSFKSIE
jgi:hypothetical protein